ncbi:MAG: ATP-binding protein [Syntrophorhabdales bacterium]
MGYYLSATGHDAQKQDALPFVSKETAGSRGSGRQTVFLALFDLAAKLTKARSVYDLIDYYAKIPVLCLDEIGYVMPTREQADHLFQIVSKRVEMGTTIVTTNLASPSGARSSTR